MSGEYRSSGSSAPSSFYPSQHSQSTIIRPPVGFAWDGPATFTASERSQHQEDSSTRESGKKKRSKEKAKDRDRAKDKSSSSSGQADRLRRESAGDIETIHHHHASMPSFSPSFRVSNYSNEPPPHAQDYAPQRDSYSPEYSRNAQPSAHDMSRNQHYRHDYDRQRDNAPTHHSHRSQPPPAHDHEQTNYRADAAYDYRQPASPTLSSAGSHVRGSSHRSTVPPPPPRYSDHTSQRLRYSPQLPPPSDTYATESTSVEPSQSRRVRMLTLLIEDIRTGESQLAEIKAPLKRALSPEQGYWADAKEVCDILQTGPSRIDGPARVLTLRGKYKQIFLRVSAEGEVECAPASLKVTPERTIDVFVEFPQSLESMLAHSTRPVAAPQPMTPLSVDSTQSKRYDVEADFHRSSSSLKRRRSDVSMSSVTPHHHSQQHYRETEPPPRDQHHEPPPPLVAENPGRHPGRGPQQRQPRAVSEDQESTSSASGSNSVAAGSPRPRALSPTQVSPQSQAESLARSSPHPGASAPISSRRYSPPHQAEHISQSSFASPQSSSAASSNQSVSASRMQPPTKKSKQSHNAVHADEASGRDMPSDYSGESGSYAPASGNTTSGAFSNYATPATFNIPTAPTSAPDAKETKRKPSQNQRAAAAASATTQKDIDSAVSTHLRSLFKAEAAWADFIESRKKVIPVSQQIKQLAYVQGKIDQHVGQTVPEGVNFATGSIISKAQVVGAFNMPPVWGDECTEVLTLSRYYGPKGQRREDARAVAMFDEPAPISTTMQMRRYLSLLRELHSQWVADHPEEGFVDASR